jgi:hypothetical protein
METATNIAPLARMDRTDFARLLTHCKVARTLTPGEVAEHSEGFAAAAIVALDDQLHKARELGAKAYLGSDPIMLNPFSFDDHPMHWEQWFEGYEEERAKYETDA